MSKAKNPNVKHYELWDGFEALDVIKTVLTKDEYIGALKFNILKYQLRLGKKDNMEKEIEKIKDYRRELDALLGSTDEVPTVQDIREVVPPLREYIGDD